MNDYLNINKKNWNSRVETHIASDFYDMKSFLNGNTSLKEIELALLPDLKDKSVLHLQCHFGQDSISLSRMGAKVTGVDFSDVAIMKGQELATLAGTDTSFICSDIYALEEKLNEKFDVVFTTYGTIGWLPDINKWAQVVSSFLKPGGTFIFADFHPVVWMFDNNFTEVRYKYFNSDAIIEAETGTYANRDAALDIQSISWNHGLAEVVMSLMNHGLKLVDVKEYDYSPYNCFQNCVETSPGKFHIKNLGDKIPMVYSIKAQKEK
jgi:2-polyprenyl-3-methyl-5-hydroxy-6-metoxy-1,4-benzoquinol methylase